VLLLSCLLVSASSCARSLALLCMLKERHMQRQSVRLHMPMGQDGESGECRGDLEVQELDTNQGIGNVHTPQHSL
jgi:hypothetical protein